MNPNVRPETMERISTPALANAFIDEQVKAIREQPGRCACELFRDLGWHAIGEGGLDVVPLLTRWFIAAESIANLDHLVEGGSIRRVTDASDVARYYPE